MYSSNTLSSGLKTRGVGEGGYSPNFRVRCAVGMPKA